MRVGLLSLAMTVGLSGVAIADPAPVFTAFLLGLDGRQVTEPVESKIERRTGGDRDIVLSSDDVVRPQARPARVAVPVRTVAARKIIRMPWTTGVYQ